MDTISVNRRSPWLRQYHICPCLMKWHDVTTQERERGPVRGLKSPGFVEEVKMSTKWLAEQLFCASCLGSSLIILCLYVADYACSAPCSAQSNFSHSRGSGSTWGAGAPTCPQPAATPPVLATTDQKLTPGQWLEEYRPLESTVSKVHVTLSFIILNIGTHYMNTWSYLSVLKSHVAPEITVKTLHCFSF